jgi:HJR/Mrr/RecB family endonuclease
MITEFVVDSLYSNEEISKSLKVANAGGVRVSTENGIVSRIVLMTSSSELKNEKENPYHDRIEKDILIYTAAGQIGDQALSGVNNRIIQQTNSFFPIYCFEIIASRRDKKVGSKRWKFVGLLEFLKHYRDTQIDTQKNIRKVWIFEFRINRIPQKIPIKFEYEISSQLINDSIQNNVENDDDRKIINLVSEKISNDEIVKIESVRKKLLQLEPRGFEFFIKDLLLKYGFINVCVTKYSQDGGIDVIGETGMKMWIFEKLIVQVQAKRWRHSVGRKDVAELRGSLKPYARGVILSTSYFSKSAIIEANEKGKNPIGLIDGYNLSKIIIEDNILRP